MTGINWAIFIYKHLRCKDICKIYSTRKPYSRNGGPIMSNVSRRRTRVSVFWMWQHVITNHKIAAIDIKGKNWHKNSNRTKYCTYFALFARRKNKKNKVNLYCWYLQKLICRVGGFFWGKKEKFVSRLIDMVIRMLKVEKEANMHLYKNNSRWDGSWK